MLQKLPVLVVVSSERLYIDDGVTKGENSGTSFGSCRRPSGMRASNKNQDVNEPLGSDYEDKRDIKYPDEAEFYTVKQRL